MKTYKARGIVLHSVNYSESSLVVYLLTDTHGRQTYMMQGARGGGGGRAGGGTGGRKGRSKTAILQPMFVLEFEGLQSPKMQMHRMKDVRQAFPLRTTPFDVRKSTISLFMAEVLYRVVREVEPHSPLFDFVAACVEALDDMEDAAAVANFHLWFLVQLSAHLGIYPGNEYLSGAWFDISEGLFTPIKPSHLNCFSDDNSRIFGLLMAADAAALAQINLARGQRSAFLVAMMSHFTYHLESAGTIRSIDILRDVF